MKLSMAISGANSTDAPKSDIILIHGTGSNSYMWTPQIKALVNLGYRTIAIDLRGHGQSKEPQQPTDISVHIADLLETLADIDVVYPAIFVGHSLGAIISLELAKTRPELFERIFAVGMPGKILPGVVFLFQLVLLLPYERLRNTRLHRLMPWRLRTLIETERFTLMQIVENFQALDYLSEPLRVSCPVHFSAGRFDPVAPAMYVKQLHRSLPHSTIQIFEFAGHNHMDQYPKSFNRWLINHIETNSFSRPA